MITAHADLGRGISRICGLYASSHAAAGLTSRRISPRRNSASVAFALSRDFADRKVSHGRIKRSSISGKQPRPGTFGQLRRAVESIHEVPPGGPTDTGNTPRLAPRNRVIWILIKKGRSGQCAGPPLPEWTVPGRRLAGPGGTCRATRLTSWLWTGSRTGRAPCRTGRRTTARPPSRPGPGTP